MRTALAFSLLLLGCGSGGGGTPDMTMSPKDMTAGVQDLHTIFSCCGQPGDKGNALGVGAFCDDQTQCPGPSAIFCASLGGDPNQHFCTMPCKQPDMGGMDPCGDGAACTCQGGQCGCVPTMCTMGGLPDGCM